MPHEKPDYDAYQSSFHEAFQTELYGILDALSLPRKGRVLDVPCGNGFYSRRLAERLGAGMQLTAVDASDSYLRQTRKTLRGTPTEVRKADAYRLPYPDATFDLVWCAQSLISLDPARAVREMFRITKRDGVVAILEVDEFHRVTLPWPTKLEAALSLAVQKATVQKYGDGAKTSPARKLRGVLKDVGFQSVRRVTHAFDRAAPFDMLTTTFLTNHFGYLQSFAYPYLPTRQQAAFDRITDPDAVDSFYRLPDTEMVSINAVYHARPAPVENEVCS